MPNGPKIYQHFHFKTLQNLSQIGIFGSKRNHLATLPVLEIFFVVLCKHTTVLGLDLTVETLCIEVGQGSML
jgi:hypothetical protein